MSRWEGQRGEGEGREGGGRKWEGKRGEILELLHIYGSIVTASASYQREGRRVEG